MPRAFFEAIPEKAGGPVLVFFRGDAVESEKRELGVTGLALELNPELQHFFDIPPLDFDRIESLFALRLPELLILIAGKPFGESVLLIRASRVRFRPQIVPDVDTSVLS